MTESSKTILSAAIKKQLVDFRRLFHSNPELKYEELQTSEFVVEHLQKLGFSYEDKIATTGVVSLIDSGKPGKTLLVRADMDALPILEENNIAYKSVNHGKMHACGHDAHVSILLAFADELKNDPSILSHGRILLVFQPAEEGGNGADRMVESGILEKYKVDAAIALHVWNHMETGKIGVVDGPVMASVDEFRIVVKGISGHGAMPQHTVDPILTASHIVTALQSLVSRNTDPLDSCVVTVGSFHSGNAFNVIPESAELVGTIRTYSRELFSKIPLQFKNIVTSVANAFNATAEIEYKRVDKPTINHPAISNIVREAVSRTLGNTALTTENVRSMGGEDFSAFLEKVPGCYFLVGSRNEAKGFIHPHHSSRFDIDEKAMEHGLIVMKESVRLYLGSATV